MKNIFLFLFIFFGLAVNAQSLDQNFTDEIYFGAEKEVLIKAVIKKAKDYYMNDADGIIKKVQKEKNIKLGKLEKRIEFMVKMETDLRKVLMGADTWGYSETYSLFNDYLISIVSLLAHDFLFPVYGKPNTGNNGKSDVTLGFTKNRLSSILVNMVTIRDNHIQNEYPYTDFTLAELRRGIRSRLGEFVHERRLWSWNMCSADRPEPVYYEKFKLRDGNISGYLEAEFGAYISRYCKSQCIYKGNQLTSVSFYLYRTE